MDFSFTCAINIHGINLAIWPLWPESWHDWEGGTEHNGQAENDLFHVCHGHQLTMMNLTILTLENTLLLTCESCRSSCLSVPSASPWSHCWHSGTWTTAPCPDWKHLQRCPRVCQFRLCDLYKNNELVKEVKCEEYKTFKWIISV